MTSECGSTPTETHAVDPSDDSPAVKRQPGRPETADLSDDSRQPARTTLPADTDRSYAPRM